MPELLTHGYFALFLIISLGLILGRIKIKGFSLDISAVIFIALIFGHFGITIPGDFQQIGLILFIFTIGIQSGAGFFESFRKHGRQFIVVAAVIVFSGGICSWILSALFKIDFKIAVGLFTGALTSTPGLAAAIESSQSSLASIGYGIAYPFGVIGVVLFVRLFPKFVKIKIKQAEEEYNAATMEDYPAIYDKNFIVENPNADEKTIAELKIATMTQAIISRVKHENSVTTPTANTELHLGDIIKANGTESALEKLQYLIGPETEEDIPLDKDYDIQWVLVTNKKVANQTLKKINLSGYFDASVPRLRRSGIEITPAPNTQIRFGDKLLIACSKENMTKVVELLGNDDKRLSETDLIPISLGIVLGILFGKLQISLSGMPAFSPGITGGVLAIAIILSSIGKTGPIIWSMSGSANQLLRQLGLLFFLSTVGTKAGLHFEETYAEYGAMLFLLGAIITTIPMIIGGLIGHYIYKINLLTLLGAITGGMTSTPGLGAVTSMTDSNAPYIAYATVYPVAMVCVIICAQIIGKL